MWKCDKHKEELMSKEKKYFNKGKYRNGTNNASDAIYYNKYRKILFIMAISIPM